MGDADRAVCAVSESREQTGGALGGKTTEVTFDASPGRVFMACRRAVADLGYTVTHTDSEAMILSFNTGRSMKSWGGQDLSASVIGGNAGTRVVVGGSLAKGGNPFGGGQLASWGEKSALSRKFLDTVAEMLPTLDEPRASSPVRAGSVGVADELIKLKGLLDAGVLSESEFESAKQRLLADDGTIVPRTQQNRPGPSGRFRRAPTPES